MKAKTNDAFKWDVLAMVTVSCDWKKKPYINFVIIEAKYRNMCH